MLDGLNKYGLPVKYAILCAIGGVISVFLANMLGYNHGGAIGGWIRQRKGKKS